MEALRRKFAPLINHRLLLRGAIEAARCALFHAELLLAARSAWDGTRALEPTEETGEQLDRLTRDARHHIRDIRSLVQAINPALFVQSEEVTRKWDAVMSAVGRIPQDDPPGSWEVEPIRAALKAFLLDSRSGARRFIDFARTYKRKHMLVFYGSALFLAVLLLVKPVNALVKERPWFALSSLGVQLLLPWLYVKLREFHLYRAWTTPEQGTELFRRLRIATFFWHPYTQYPVGTQPFAPDGDLLRRVIWARLTIAAQFFLALVIASGLMWHLAALVPPGARTVVILFGIVAMLLFAVHLLDLADWLENLPLRYLSLLFTLSLLLLCGYWDVPTGAVGVAVITIGSLLLILALLPSIRPSFPRIIRLPFGILIFAAGLFVGGALVIANERSLEDAWTEPSGGPARSMVAALSWPFKPFGATGEGPPVLVVAAAGGGSRAAYFTARVLRALDETCPDGKPTGCPAPLGHHIHAISSVSGGSLATSAYVSARYQRRTTRYLPRAMRTDFLQPVLLGAVNPMVSRSENLLHTWRGPSILNGQLTLGRLARRWNTHNGSTPPFPMPLINSSTLDSHMVVISPLTYRAYTDGLYREASHLKLEPADRGGEATWVRFRSGIYGLDNLLSRRDPDLAEATLASANFPFGFPLVRLETGRPLVFSPVEEDRRPGTKKRLFLTDGGVLSNSGIWSLYHLLANAAETRDSASPWSLQGRGVILLIIDISKMPTYHGRSSDHDLYQAITDQAPLGDNIHRRMLELLDHKLNGCLRVIQIALAPNKTTNVYTSWTLDGDSLDDLDEQFDAQWNPGGGGGLKDRITTAWSDLVQGKPAPRVPGLEPRVPLD